MKGEQWRAVTSGFTAETHGLTPTSVVGCASVKLNDCTAVSASQTLAWVTVPHPPNGNLMKFIIDESHHKENGYVLLPVSLA